MRTSTLKGDIFSRGKEEVEGAEKGGKKIV
jgi:hypothetical protein